MAAYSDTTKLNLTQFSLHSLQKANYAVRMYLKLGFKIIHETEEEFVMLKDLSLSY